MAFLSRRKKSKSKNDLLILEFEEKIKIENMCIDCRKCNDTGIIVVAYVRVEMPDDPCFEYRRCCCGASLHKRLEGYICL